MYFQHKLKYFKRSDHVTGDVMSLLIRNLKTLIRERSRD